MRPQERSFLDWLKDTLGGVKQSAIHLSEQSWKRVSLLLDGELVGAVSEVRWQLRSGWGRDREHGRGSTGRAEGRCGWVRVCAYIAVDDSTWKRSRKLEEALW